MLIVLVLGTTSILLFVSLVSVLISQKNHFELEHANQTKLTGGNENEIANTDGLQAASNKTRNYCLTPDCVKVAASVIEAIDLTVDPCDDFYVSI